MAEGSDYSVPHSEAAEKEEEEEEVGTVSPTGKTYPSNSKTIFADQIFEVTTLLDLPRGASVAETH